MATAATISQWSSNGQHHTRSASTSKMASSSRQAKHADMYDRFYGHREISELSECVITALFACPLDSTSSSVNGSSSQQCGNAKPTPRLAEFIAYALHRTRLPDEITFQALFLLRRLKSRFPAARGSSGHRLFISALMLASKSSCDDTYSNKSWTIVSQGLFSLREVNQMERELFGYLGYKVNVEFEELDAFTSLLLSGDVATVVDMGNGASSTTAPSSPVVTEEYNNATHASSADVTPTKMSSMQSQNAVHAQSYSMSRQHSNQHHSRASMSAVYAGQANVSPKSVAINAMASASVPSFYPTTDAYVSNVSHGHNVRAPYTVQQQQQVAAAMHHHLSPSMASMSSSRGSISSASQYSMTPSPTGLSQSESSNSSRASPDTPPAEFEASPWTDDGKSTFSGEPAGTYDDEYQFYHQSMKQPKQAQYYGGVAGQHVYIGDVHPAYQS